LPLQGVNFRLAKLKIPVSKKQSRVFSFPKTEYSL
jgi:hypothetical protein